MRVLLFCHSAMRSFLVLAAPLLSSTSQASSPAAKPVVNRSHWTLASLPFAPTGIGANGADMWACGNGETIAKSVDEGKTWQVVYRREKGTLLRQIAWATPQTGFAVGFGGVLLVTADGGATWNRHVAAGTHLLSVSMADAQHGIAHTREGLALTSDGGTTWKTVTALQADERARDFSIVESVAALDATHDLAALHRDQGENLMFSTADGGATWTPLHLENTFAGSVFAHGGEYWAFGIEYLGREHNPGGGYGVGVVLHSADGLHWTHGVRPLHESGECAVQGCYDANSDVIADQYGAAEQFWSAPQDKPLGTEWAMADGHICTIGREGDLRCGSVLASPGPQPMPKDYVITMNTNTAAPLPGCFRCALAPVRRDPRLNKKGAMAQVRASFTLSSDGTVTAVAVQPFGSPVMEQSVTELLRRWIVEPEDGASGKPIFLTMQLLCFPAMNGEAADESCSIAAVKQL